MIEPRDKAREAGPPARPCPAPSLVRVNGCGAALFGRRDVDKVTGTYVATLYLTLAYIPMLALRAYRVSDAESGGWYFLGREPLSTFAKLNNMTPVLLGLFVVLLLWHHGLI